ncbi:MAG: electron transport complex subunit RsxC [Gammaproteobacteria bacterium]|nr:electron transport complex subunit RsxC [Gammaproteobacteria bacterium]
MFGLSTFKHGVHPREYKELSNQLPIRRLPFAPTLVLPLSQHAGKPSVPLVQPGQEVVRGQPIAAADGFMSVPLHAPATGRIKRIELMPTARGPKTDSFILEVYQGSNQQHSYDNPQDLAKLQGKDIVQLVQDAGMVGLGGAAFPTHVKMTPPPEHQVDTLVANGCECEPYLTCDHRIMLEQPEQLIQGTRLIMRALGVERAIIGIEDNKLDAVKAISELLPAHDPITVQAVETKYPQGAEKMLIKSVLGRSVPPGSFPSAVGVSVFNVGTLAQIGELLPHGRGVIERVVTVSGPGVEHPGNYLVPVGTPVRFLLEHAGVTSGAHEVILGGPMMGMSVSALDVPVTKAMSGMVVLEQNDPDLHKQQAHPCIRCGWCVEACPMQLNPSMLGMLAASSDYDEMANDYHLNDCFECGSCSYVCPSNIPLVQYFRIAKSVLRERAEVA